jgi:tRNA modification GTPase
MFSGDTIAAISSPVGPCARMIVRLSGPDAHSLLASLAAIELPARGIRRVTLSFARLHVPSTIYTFASGASYTGQPTAEAHLPGNPMLADLLLRELLSLGARLAEPGEFTARAFFNGRLDLTEAEGVAATIAAHSQEELSAARRLQAGELTARLKPIVERVTQLLALIEAGIDFSEEDVQFISFDDARRRARDIGDQLRDLVANSMRFERLSHEPVIVLCGRPNAGKSTLLNALCGMDRAIVSPVAGTTRDAVSQQANLLRGRVRLVDVAGLDAEPPTPADDPAGIHLAMRHKALNAIEQADVTVLVRDVQDTRPPLDLPVLPHLTVFTMLDLLRDPAGPPLNGPSSLCVSAQTGLRLSTLIARLDELAFGHASAGSGLALNARHQAQIHQACEALGRVVQTRVSSEELLALELRDALDSLGQITGVVCPDEILGRIFATFCIGK